MNRNSPSTTMLSPVSIWQAPLVPVALTFTAGVLADRFFFIPFWYSVAATFALLAAWFATHKSRQKGLALIYLWSSATAFGAGYHHWFREDQKPNDVGNLTSADPRPVYLRGVLHTEPYDVPHIENDPLRTQMPRETSRAVLRTTQVYHDAMWQPISGLAMLQATGSMSDLHVGDEIELVGRLFFPEGPGNPGEQDYAAYLRDQRIRAILVVKDASQSIRRIDKRWPHTIRGWLAMTRVWANDVLRRYLPEKQRRVASALLLGDRTEMAGAEWEKYVQTGVIHVLAISGMHLMVLAGFLWLVLRVFHVRRRSGAVAVAIFLLGYALLTGGRPPVMRSACMMLALCGGMLLRRPTMPANVFSLAWLVVLFINPTDVANGGFLLSFLAVAVLSWGVRAFSIDAMAQQYQTTTSGTLIRPGDPLQNLIDENRPFWSRMLRRFAWNLFLLYIISAVLWFAVMPLVAHRYHVVSPVALLIAPIMMLLSSVALLSGFLVLLFGAFVEPLAWPVALITNGSLWASNMIVSTASKQTWAFWYVTAPPDWWLVVLYAGLLFWLTHPVIRQRRWWCTTAIATWILVLPIFAWTTPPNREFRCTFLAVGHGGCTVIETPDGRTLIYDAGAISGPDVTRRQIAPFLWERGIRRIDELFLSHADLDHFNGAPDLLTRFPVGRVTLTPTFQNRATPGALLALQEFRRRDVPIHVVKANDVLKAGDVTLEVLHPPLDFAGNKENERSMVLLVSHQGRSILLTGDLEGDGMERFLRGPPMPIDVLMAPHHGSQSASPAELARWATPKLVVSSQAKTIWESNTNSHYEKLGAVFLPTWEHGAVTVHVRDGAIHAETFRTKKHWSFD